MQQAGTEQDTCWFCGERPSDAALQVHVYRTVTGRRSRRRGAETQFLVDTVVVPRCGTCRAAHKRVKWLTAAFTVLGAGVGFAAFSLIDRSEAHGNRLGAVLGLGMMFIGYSAGDRIGRMLLPGRAKPESARADYPALKTLQEAGWRIGRRPGMQAESDPASVGLGARKVKRRKRARPGNGRAEPDRETDDPSLQG